METAAARTHADSPIVFVDALGTRRRVAAASGDTLESLALAPELTTVAAFEFSLRERANRLSAFRHPSFARVRGIDRTDGPAATLAVLSEYTRGVRVSSLLNEDHPARQALDINMTLHLVRQLVTAVAALHETGRDVAHGAIGPERVLVTPNARVLVVEYVLGAALEQLRFSYERYWKELRIPVPPSPGLPRLGQRADVAQIGVVALSLILGRGLRDDEYPARLNELVGSAWSISPRGGLEPLPPGLRTWLWHALQLDPKHAFATAMEARDGLDKVAPGRADVPAFAASLMSAEEESQQPTEPVVIAPARPVEPVRPAPVVPTAVQHTVNQHTAVHHTADQPAVHHTAVHHTEPPMAVTVRPRKRMRNVAAAAVALVAVSTGGVVAARRFLVAPAAPVVTTGSLSLSSNPAGAEVFIDGVPRGQTPLTLTLNAGGHALELRGPGEPRTITVTVAAGGQLSQYIELPALMPAAAPASAPPAAAAASAVPVESQFGWLTVSAPVDVQIYEHQRLIGTSQSDRVMVSAGRHDIEIVNESLGYRVTRTIQVPPGKVAPIRLEWPRGTLSVNALPWAEVWIDGDRVGETPIGNMSLPIGPHELVFRHPEFGEQRHAATITATAPARVSVDLRKKP